MFEIGLVVCFVNGIINFNSAIYSVFGMLAGGGIFLIIWFSWRSYCWKRSNGNG